MLLNEGWSGLSGMDESDGLRMSQPELTSRGATTRVRPPHGCCQSDCNQSPVNELSPHGVNSFHERLPLGQASRVAGVVSLAVDEAAFLEKGLAD